MTWTLNRNFGTDGSYIAYRNRFIQERENPALFNTRLGGSLLHMVGGNPTLGFGYDLSRHNASVIFDDLRAAGITLSADQRSTITNYKAGLITAQNAFDQLNGLQSTREQALALFDRVIERYEGMADAQLRRYSNPEQAGTIARQLLDTNVRNSVERALLVDLAYQNSTFIGPKFVQALVEGNRAAAWFELRYGNTTGTPDRNVWLGLDSRFRARAEAWGLEVSSPAAAYQVLDIYLGRQGDVTKYIADLSLRSTSRGSQLQNEALGIIQQAGQTVGLSGTFGIPGSRITYTPRAHEDLTYLGEAFGTGASILVANPTLVGQTSLPAGVTLNLPNRVETLVGYMMDVRGVPTNQADFNRLSLSLQSAANDMLANFANGVTPNFQRLEPGESVPEGFQGHMFTAADGTRVLAWGRVGNPALGSRNYFERADGSVRSEIARPPRCFLAGTPILMADGQEKPIEDIRVGDMVMSFDPSADQGRGALVPKPVSRTFQNITRSIIDLRGLHMTPGHVCLTDDGRFETIAEILLRDGILIEADGTPIRARTGAKVGSMEDTPVLIAYPDEKTGKEIFVRARAGIPCRLVRERDGTKRHLSLALMLRAYHQTLTPEGLILSPDGSLGEATDWPEDSTPMDEDYRRNWVIQTADGKPYVPEWIQAVAEEAREEQTVGATLQRIISPPSQRFTPRVVDNPTPPARNRAERRAQKDRGPK